MNRNDVKTYIAIKAYRDGTKKYLENDRDKIFEKLKANDDTGKWIYYAGVNWPEFDFEKGFKALLEKDLTGEWIYRAGREWKKFDEEKGLNALIKRRNGLWVLNAGTDWEKFNYEKGLAYLRSVSKDRYEEAMKAWPKNKKNPMNLTMTKGPGLSKGKNSTFKGRNFTITGLDKVVRELKNGN